MPPFDFSVREQYFVVSTPLFIVYAGEHCLDVDGHRRGIWQHAMHGRN